VLGWRLWRLRGECLQSWGVDYVWEPGPNRAMCIGGGRACVPPPGKHCQCGFWALWSPLHCLARAQEAVEPPWHVLGLISGWGCVALHGTEGFRAEHASVVSLFTDWAGRVPVPALAERRLERWLRGALAPPLSPRWQGKVEGPGRLPALWSAARRYGVPLISLQGALGLRVLGEWGIPPRGIQEVEAWVAAAAAPMGDD